MHYFRVVIPIADTDDHIAHDHTVYIQSDDDTLTLDDVRNVCKRCDVNAKTDLYRDCIESLATAVDQVFMHSTLHYTSTFNGNGDRITFERIEFEPKERRHASRI